MTTSQSETGTGGGMHALRRGTGPPLLLVHGLGSLATTWSPVLDQLAAERSVIALDLPGFGRTPPLAGPVTIATLTDAVEAFIDAQGLAGIDTVGSSMGARMVLELARRGVGGHTVALDPGGFWRPAPQRAFGLSVAASVRLVRLLQPVLPALTGSPVGRTALLAQFSARPWALPAELVLAELRNFATSPSFDAALAALARGPLQGGAAAGSTPGRVLIGWGRKDRVTLPSQAARAIELFPGAELHWFDRCGHFPHWDRPAECAEVILRGVR